MIGVDTNIIVRLLVQDDPHQSRKTTQYMQKLANRGERVFLNKLVLCETVWVLGSAYQLNRSDIADAIQTLLNAAIFEIDDRDTVIAALKQYRSTKADFADGLIGETNLHKGCETTITFDKHLKKLDAFEVL